MSTRHIRGHLVYRSSLEKTGSGNVSAADLANISLLLVNKTSGAATGVTLPTPGYDGQALKIVDAKGDAATNNITITPGSGTINGAATHVISENYGSVELVWDGTNWTVSAASNQIAAAEMGFVNGVTAGTPAASKAVVLDANSNVTTFGQSGLRITDIGSVNAAGSGIGNATAITNRFTVVGAADNSKGVILPVPTAGDMYLVISSVASNGLKVYPQVNSSINFGTANAAYTMEGQVLHMFVANNTTNWCQIGLANA